MWVRIDPADTVTVFTGKVELGQGLRAALARIAADELDIASERVRVETADTAHGLDEGETAGSLSMEQSGTALRQAAAEARAYLVGLAAAELGVDAEQLRVEDGAVLGGGRATSYWELLGGRDFGVDASGAVPAKPPSKRRYSGRPGHRPDLLGIVTGTRRYVQDLVLPGMLHARIVRPPSAGARLESAGSGRVEELPGIVSVVRDGSFLGVVAEREEQAIAAAAALAAAARWSEQASLPPVRALPAWLKSQPDRAFLVVDGVPVEGEPPPLPAPPVAATQTVRAAYSRPYLLHGSIGPSAAVARWERGGLEVWSSSQGVYALRGALARALRIEAESIRIRHVEGPGCYGHNSADDVALDAALLARPVEGRPVRVVHSREDEHACEPYGPAMVVELQASLDAEGRLLDWNHDVWSNRHGGRPGEAPEGTSGLRAAWSLADPLPRSQPVPALGYHGGEYRNADPLYTLPRRRIVNHFVAAEPLRVSALRSLGAFTNVFALESFLDEVAAAAQVDPLELRLAYLDDERAREVLRLAADRIRWQDRGEEFGHGVGLAFARYKNRSGYAAVAVELGVDDLTAAVGLERVVVAADAGQVIDPDGLANQLEGGVVQAASWTIREALAFDDTRVTSVDWDTYPIITFSEVPRIEVELIDRPELPPLGAGEVTQGPTAAAIANAVYDAVGVRVRDLPITPDRIRESLAAA
jgi:CO/xanthine dehydrogenase Mo-binding subunit